MSRLGVAKTYKMYIGGKFVRSESGRSLAKHGGGRFIANYCQASRKDLRDAVKEARSAFDGWQGRSPYNRGQILYRLAEMLEARTTEFVEIIRSESKLSEELALLEIQASIDRCVYYCGWTDKYQAVFGSVNPVSSPFFDFSVPEPTGIVGVVADEGTPLIGLVSQALPVIASGNTCVVLASDRYPLTALELGEALATSDLPGGVVNVLTGEKAELLPHLARHMDVNAISYCDGDADQEAELIAMGSENLKRIVLLAKKGRSWWLSNKAQGPEWIERFTETKTVWHPIGL